MRPDWLSLPRKTLDTLAGTAAADRQSVLTKPPGSLGRLEEVAVRLAAMQGSERPRADEIRIAVFAGDHGVAAESVSAFPQAVTAAMVRNFAAGGAAISVLARELGAGLEIVDLGTVPGAEEPGRGVTRLELGAGTANFTGGPAMTEQQVARALEAGRGAATRAGNCDLFIGGEMGIGNTTAAAAMTAALLELEPGDIAGPGTGLDARGVRRKAEVIGRGLHFHRKHLADPFEVLRRLGGFEIAALAGAFIACAQAGKPALVDGFIATTAALTAERLHPGTLDWLLFTHRSAEPGHRLLLGALGQAPLLDLGMRLGEGSGAAVAVPLLRLACALHNGMATFEEAGI